MIFGGDGLTAVQCKSCWVQANIYISYFYELAHTVLVSLTIERINFHLNIAGSSNLSIATQLKMPNCIHTSITYYWERQS